MRILYFSRDYTTHDYRFLARMAKTEHEIFYLRLERGPQQYEDRPLPVKVRQVNWAGGRAPMTWRAVPRLVRSLRRVLRSLNPDLVQAGPIQQAAFLTALAGFRPLVSMSWGYDLLHDMHRGRVWKWATRFTLKRSAAMIGDCETIRSLAVNLGMEPSRIVTFPWGADIQRFSQGSSPGHTSPLRMRRGWGPDHFVLLSTRGWAPLYGVDDLVTAFVRASREHPQLRLLMLGDGPLSAKIMGTIHRAGLIDRVQFPGLVSQEQLPEYYRAADLYVSASHSDGTSISLLESMASGTPVLLSDIPGNQEWVREYAPISAAGPAAGNSAAHPPGWLFPDGDPVGLEKAIRYAIENRDRLAAMGRAARSLAERRGDWEKNSTQLYQAWEIATGVSSPNARSAA